MTRIGQAIMLHHAGDREEARNRFARAVGGDRRGRATPLHRCTLAHYMADTQDDPADELGWDLRALSAADALSQERVRWRGAPPRGARALSLAASQPRGRLRQARQRRWPPAPICGAPETDRRAGGRQVRRRRPGAIDRLELRLADDTLGRPGGVPRAGGDGAAPGGVGRRPRTVPGAGVTSRRRPGRCGPAGCPGPSRPYASPSSQTCVPPRPPEPPLPWSCRWPPLPTAPGRSARALPRGAGSLGAPGGHGGGVLPGARPRSRPVRPALPGRERAPGGPRCRTPRCRPRRSCRDAGRAGRALPAPGPPRSRGGASLSQGPGASAGGTNGEGARRGAGSEPDGPGPVLARSHTRRAAERAMPSEHHGFCHT